MPTDITTYLFTAALGAVILFLFLIRFVYSKPPPPTQLSTPAQRERRPCPAEASARRAPATCAQINQ